MNILGRIFYAIIDHNPETSQIPIAPQCIEEKSCEENPGIMCRWIEATFRCRSPMGDGEGSMPSGCDANCPARIQNDILAREIALENQRRTYR